LTIHKIIKFDDKTIVYYKKKLSIDEKIELEDEEEEDEQSSKK